MMFFILLWSALAHAETTLLSRYEALMEKYPAVPLAECVAPKILSNPETRRYRSALKLLLKEHPPEANFCGKYLLMEQPITGGGDLYVADCETGKIKTIKGIYAWHFPYAKATSCLLVKSEPDHQQADGDFGVGVYGPPQLFVWQKEKLTKLKDPIWPAQK